MKRSLLVDVAAPRPAAGETPRRGRRSGSTSRRKGSRRSAASRRSSSFGSAGVVVAPAPSQATVVVLQTPSWRRGVSGYLSVQLPVCHLLCQRCNARCVTSVHTSPLRLPDHPPSLDHPMASYAAWLAQRRKLWRQPVPGMAANPGRQAAAVHLDDLQAGAQASLKGYCDAPLSGSHRDTIRSVGEGRVAYQSFELHELTAEAMATLMHECAVVPCMAPHFTRPCHAITGPSPCSVMA